MLDLLNSSCSEPSTFKLKRSSSARRYCQCERSRWMYASASVGSLLKARSTACVRVSGRAAALAVSGVWATTHKSVASQIFRMRSLFFIGENHAVLEPHDALGIFRDR